MHANSACMFYAPNSSKIVWKSQNGTKTPVNLGAGKKLTCFDPLWKGCLYFLLFFLTIVGPAHHTYNIPLTKKYFNEIILFQNSPVQPLTPASPRPPLSVGRHYAWPPDGGGGNWPSMFSRTWCTQHPSHSTWQR